MVVFQDKKGEEKMTYMVIRMVREWALDNLSHNKNMGDEYRKAVTDLLVAASKVMKFL